MIRWRFWNWLSKMGSVSNYDQQVILCLEVEQIVGYCTMKALICWQNHYFGDRRSISVTDIWYYISSRPQTIKTCHQHKQSSTSIISIDVVIYCTRCCLKIIMCFSKNFIFLIHLSSNQVKIIRLIIKFQSIFLADGGQVFANSLGNAHVFNDLDHFCRSTGIGQAVIVKWRKITRCEIFLDCWLLKNCDLE